MGHIYYDTDLRSFLQIPSKSTKGVTHQTEMARPLLRHGCCLLHRVPTWFQSRSTCRPESANTWDWHLARFLLAGQCAACAGLKQTLSSAFVFLPHFPSVLVWGSMNAGIIYSFTALSPVSLKVSSMNRS